jgi:hypothetical protein
MILALWEGRFSRNPAAKIRTQIRRRKARTSGDGHGAEAKTVVVGASERGVGGAPHAFRTRAASTIRASAAALILRTLNPSKPVYLP